MPKNTNAAGPTYAGHEDITPEGVTPEWVDVSRETEPEPEVEDRPKRGRPAGSKNKPKESTTAKAGNAAGTGSTRG